MNQSGFRVTLSSEFGPAGIGGNVRREWQSSQVGVTVSLLGRRAKAVDSFAIGTGRFSPGCQVQGIYKTIQCKGLWVRCTFWQWESSHVKNSENSLCDGIYPQLWYLDILPFVVFMLLIPHAPCLHLFLLAHWVALTSVLSSLDRPWLLWPPVPCPLCGRLVWLWLMNSLLTLFQSETCLSPHWYNS